jgi:hypothetical protein
VFSYVCCVDLLCVLACDEVVVLVSGVEVRVFILGDVYVVHLRKLLGFLVLPRQLSSDSFRMCHS